MNGFEGKVAFIWSVADLLRGPYRPNQYKDIMLPMTVLRRLDCVLEPTKEKVLEEQKRLSGSRVRNVDPILCRVTGVPFYNTSRYTFEKLKGDPNNIAANLTNYIKGFSTRAREIIEHFGFEEHIAKLDKADRLYLVVSKFCDIDLHPHNVSNIEMGYIFEELIRRFNEASNEEAGDHFTPREVIRLMVNLLFMPDGDILTIKGILKTLYDPACGTGGMLSVAEDYVRELNPNARLEVFGQDYNDQAYAICGSDMMIKGQDIDHIAFGDSFTSDRFSSYKFDYMLANPPFGVEWKPEADFITREHEEQGFGGRFGAGLPRINDGSLLFLMHMISKMKDPIEGGTRLGIVFNGSPLFNGLAGSGESEIRRWIIENDWLEAVVALPDQLFYNTDIYTYIWIVTNRKKPSRRGKIQLVDGTKFFKKMRKSLGNKRNEVCDEQRDEITRLYGNLEDSVNVRIFDNEDFGYRRITVERPLRLSFAVDETRIASLKEITPFSNLSSSKKRKDIKSAQAEIEEGRKLQEDILAALWPLAGQGVVKNREQFSDLVKAAFKKAGLTIPATLFKGIIIALAKQDETADVCTDAKGNPEPDPDLRDYDNVPLKEDVHEYMKRDILPYLPDAWVDESRTKIGYEINFAQYFYSFPLPRTVSDITNDLVDCEQRLAQLLGQLTHKAQGMSRAVSVGLGKAVPMQRTGIAWIGDIPAHWNIKPLFALMRHRKEKNVGAGIQNVLSLSYGRIVQRNVEENFGLLPTSFDTYQIIHPDDIILRLTDLQNDHKSLRVGLVKDLGIITSAYVCLEVQSEVVPAYAYYLLHAYDLMKVFYSYGGGVRQAMKYEDLKRLPMLCPPVPEQEDIVAFLNEEAEGISSIQKEINTCSNLISEYHRAPISLTVSGKVNIREEIS